MGLAFLQIFGIIIDGQLIKSAPRRRRSKAMTPMNTFEILNNSLSASDNNDNLQLQLSALCSAVIKSEEKF